jgi:hypothetical protein
MLRWTLPFESASLAHRKGLPPHDREIDALMAADRADHAFPQDVGRGVGAPTDDEGRERRGLLVIAAGAAAVQPHPTRRLGVELP